MRELKPLLGLDDINKIRTINLHVLTLDGKDTLVTVAPTDHIKSIKEKLLGEEGVKDSPNYKVILLSPRRVLEDQHTIEQEGIIDGDQFLVSHKRRSTSIPFRKGMTSKGPDQLMIKTCTDHLGEEKGTAASNPGLGYAGMFDFFGELKRILVSLTEVASLVQHVPNEEDQESDMETDDELQIDALCLQKLTDMGFTAARGTKALIMNNMCPVQAMEWLLQHETDHDIDEPLTSEQIQTYSPDKRHRSKRKRGGGAAGRKKEFQPNARALTMLKEMGFEEKDVVMALKYSSNNEERALDWLLGDRQPVDQTLDGGLDPSSALYAAIMDHPVVQLGMTNPRILHAFEDMLENPNNSGQYINDPEIGPVLLQISRIVQSFSR